MRHSLKIIEKYPRITIIHHQESDGGLWATSKRNILYRKDTGWEQVAEFPRSYPRDLFGFSRPTARAMRADKCNLYVNQKGSVLGIRGGAAYAIENGQARFLFNIHGDSVLHRSICEDEQGNIYFGEYFMNPERIPVRVWQVSPDLSAWKAACELPHIRHVHGVFPDPYDEGVFWITVGDFAGECYLLRTPDGFKTFERFGDGSQVWRAVNLFFTKEHICWVTDSNLELNHAYRMKRRDASLEQGQEIDCSAWYGCTTVEDLHITFTTVERGPAILSNESSLLVSEDAFHWQKVYGFKKDFWRPVKVFKYGVISCPSGKLSARAFYISGEGLVGLDGASMKVEISGGAA